MNATLTQTITDLIAAHGVLLFMKGGRDAPQCGFSSQVVQILKHAGADFHTVNILDDEALRQGMKEFSNWPTFPQLYINGEFIGGCDIVIEMFQKNELQPLLDKARKAS